MKLTKEEIILNLIENAIRLTSYGIVAGIGWKVTNKMAEREITRDLENDNLKIEVLELKNNELERKIEKLKK